MIKDDELRLLFPNFVVFSNNESFSMKFSYQLKMIKVTSNNE